MIQTAVGEMNVLCSSKLDLKGQLAMAMIEMLSRCP